MFRSMEGDLNNTSKNSYLLGSPSLYMRLMAYRTEFVEPAKQKQNVLNYRNVNWKYQGDEFVLETKNSSEIMRQWFYFIWILMFVFSFFLFRVCV